MGDDGGDALDRLGQAGLGPRAEVGGVDRGRHPRGDGERGLEAGQPVDLVGPEEGAQPQAPVLGADVDGVAVAAGPLGDLDRPAEVGQRAAADRRRPRSAQGCRGRRVSPVSYQ